MRGDAHPGADDPRPAPGTPLTVIKLGHDGREVARYPGMTIPSPPGWVAARAEWVFERMDLGYLIFDPNDIFLEYFSLTRPYNAFALYTVSGTFKGWYCNVTHPSWLEDGTLYWHDLYLDLIVYPDGRQLVLDEDELKASGIAESDPALHQLIVAGHEELVRLAQEQRYPFSEAPAAIKSMLAE